MSYDPTHPVDPCPTDKCEIDSGFVTRNKESDVSVEDCSNISQREDCNYPCICKKLRM